MAGEKNKLGGQFVLGVVASLVAAMLWVVLASFFGVLDDLRYLPLWGFLTIFTVLIVGCAWVVYLTNRSLREKLVNQVAAEKEWEDALQDRDTNLGEQLGHWARAEKDFKARIKELEDELEERDEVVYADGLYYLKTDTTFRQPFCRVCWDKNDQMTTIVDTTTLDNGYRYYQCPACGEQHPLPSRPVGDPDAYQPDEEYPF